MRHHVVRSIVGAHGEGNKQHADFVAHRLQSTQIPQQKQACEQHQGRQALTKTTMHDNAQERNNDRLLEVENADCPPSLSKYGVLRSGQKSELLSCVEVDCPSDFDEADAQLIDLIWCIC